MEIFKMEVIKTNFITMKANILDYKMHLRSQKSTRKYSETRKKKQEMPRFSKKRREIFFYAGIIEYGYEISIVYAFQLDKGDIRSGRIGTWTNPSYTINNPHYAALKSLEKLFEHIGARNKFNKRKIKIVAFWDSAIRNGYSSLKNNLDENLKKYDVELVSLPRKMWRTSEHVKTFGLLKNHAEFRV